LAFLKGNTSRNKLFAGPAVPRGRNHIFAIGANAERVRCGMVVETWVDEFPPAGRGGKRRTDMGYIYLGCD
jgi:hypothetical protein